MGTPPHPSVPVTLHAGIAAMEAAHPDASAWTLTWLEGRPRCLLDDVVIVTLDASGTVATEALRGDEPEDDDWLA